MTQRAYSELTKICVVTLGLIAFFISGCGSGSGSISIAAKIDDSKSVVRFFSVSQLVNEGVANQTVQIDISPASSSPIEVEYALSGTATSLLDFTSLTSSRFTIPAGATSASINFVVIDDLLTESTETLAFQLTQVVSGPAELGATTLHTATIVDNETVSLTVSDATVTEGGVATFTAALSATSTLPVSFTWSTADGTGDSSTTYNSGSGTVIIPPLSTSATFTVNTRDNSTVCETSKTFSVSLASVSGATLVDGTGEATVTDPDRPVVSFVASTSGVTEGSSASVAIALSAVCSLHDVTVVPAVIAQTATSGSDYTAPTPVGATLTISAGQLSAILSIPALNDTFTELGETLMVALGDPTNATMVGTPTHVVTINDPVPTLSIADIVVNEGSMPTPRTLTYTVTLSHASASAVTVNYSTSDGTATTADGDYVTKSGSLTIPAGQISGTFGTVIYQDYKYESNEVFNVTLSGGSGYESSGSDLTATVTLTNDDTQPTVSFTVASASGAEGGTVTVTAQLSKASNEAISVNASASGTAIYMPLALVGEAYDVTGGGFGGGALTYSFPAGTTSVSKTFDIALCGGSEGSETFILTLGTPTNATLGTTTVHTTTIADYAIDDTSCSSDPFGNEPAIITAPEFDGGAMPTPPPD